jgi:hypothetical protein
MHEMPREVERLWSTQSRLQGAENTIVKALMEAKLSRKAAVVVLERCTRACPLLPANPKFNKRIFNQPKIRTICAEKEI